MNNIKNESIQLMTSSVAYHTKTEITLTNQVLLLKRTDIKLTETVNTEHSIFKPQPFNLPWLSSQMRSRAFFRTCSVSKILQASSCVHKT